MRLFPKFNLRSPVAAVFTPSDRFFLRLVPLAPDLPAPGQVELALEGLAPFPAAQLFWGCCVAPDRTSALVYAAHRRRFTAEETAAWERADLVVPDLLALLGAAPAGPTILIHTGDNRLTGAAWAGSAKWPVAVHTRAYPAPPAEDMRLQFAAELEAKAGLKDATVKLVTGTPRARREGDNLVFELADVAGSVVAATTVTRPDQNVLDIRDRGFLDKRRRDQNRGEFIWKVLLGGVAAAGLAAVFDAGALTINLVNRVQHKRVELQAPFVQKLDIAHTLTSRVDELTHRRLRFFEMLSTINEPRPRSISFNRTGTNGHLALEIEAQTNSADDVGTYEAALRKIAALEKVEIHDLRARDGVTTFGLSVAFKVEGAPGTGGAP
jgi:hypothetical protein